MIDPMNQPGVMTLGAPTPMPPTDALSGMGSRLGLDPNLIAQIRARLQTLPPELHVPFLRQALLAIPGVREKMQAMISPQAQTVAPVDGAPPSMGTLPLQTPGQPNTQFPLNPAGQAQPGNGASDLPVRDSAGLNRGMQKRVAAGKALPKGIAKRAAGDGATPRGGGRFNQQPTAGVTTDMGTLPMQVPNPAPRQFISDYRAQRMGLGSGGM